MTKELYTAHATSTRGRSGECSTDDGALKLKLVDPTKSSGKSNETNPEQLFACGYSACFGSAIEAIAKHDNINVESITVEADVTLNKDARGYFLNVVLDVTIPGLDQEAAEKLVASAHQVCPYSKATRGNIDVVLKANEKQLLLAA